MDREPSELDLQECGLLSVYVLVADKAAGELRWILWTD